MQTTQIENIIHKHIPKDLIHSYHIGICPINGQIEHLTIHFKPDVNYNLTAMGAILEDLVELTIDDGYGDLTTCDIQFNTFQELPGSDDMYPTLIYKINIDS